LKNFEKTLPFILLTKFKRGLDQAAYTVLWCVDGYNRFLNKFVVL
jgi:hypothetical protein